jgi:hypothetical protein
MIVGLVLISGYAEGSYRSSPYSYVIDIDPSFDTSDTLIILRSLSDWQNISDYQVRFTALIQKCQPEIFVICLNRVEPSFFDTPINNVKAAGVTYHSSVMMEHSVINLAASKDTDRTPEQFQGIIEHEMGHGLGLSHATSGVMYWQLGGGDLSVTCADYSQWATLRNMTETTRLCPTVANYAIDHSGH